MFTTAIACACGSEFEVEADRREMDSSVTCDCGKKYLLTVTQLDYALAD